MSNIKPHVDLTTSLYASSKLARQIEEKLIENNGELTQEIEALCACKIERDQDNAQEVDSKSLTLERLDQSLAFYTAQIKILEVVCKGLQASHDQISNNMLTALQNANLDEASGLNRVVKIVSNPSSVDVLNLDLIPKEFFDVELVRKLKKSAVKEYLKTANLEGARLINKKRIKIDIKS